MAELRKIKNESPQKKHSALIIAMSVFSIVIALICAVAVFKHGNYLAASIFAFALLVFIFTLKTYIRNTLNDKAAKRYGDAGEYLTGEILEEELPDDYTVIQNAIIKYKDGASETDNIVVGKTGVFIIEVKNVKGIISNTDRHYWTQDKTDRYGITHSDEFYSPVKQVNTHVYRLANYLRDNKVFTHINAAVYFSNPETKVYVQPGESETPVFTYDTTDELIYYILSGNENLSPKTINRIIQLIEENSSSV